MRPNWEISGNRESGSLHAESVKWLLQKRLMLVYMGHLDQMVLQLAQFFCSTPARVSAISSSLLNICITPHALIIVPVLLIQYWCKQKQVMCYSNRRKLGWQQFNQMYLPYVDTGSHIAKATAFTVDF